jgi:DNA-binding MarR family transcriptional regulator/GNAT superfamily N-acetyltransferase
MSRNQADRIRSFNHVVTQRIVDLEDLYVARGRPRHEVRIILEMGSHGGSLDVRTLRAQLSLKESHTSRLLRSLERQGLIELLWVNDVQRHRAVGLTEKGHGAYAEYEALAEDFAASVLETLSTDERARLVAAMTEVKRLLQLAAIEVAFEPANTKDAARCHKQYFEELNSRFEKGFKRGNTGGDLAEGHFAIARINGEAVGCGTLRELEPGIGEIKRIWVANRVRGQGVAGRLMQALEQKAREEGFHTLRLDTNKALAEAQALYLKLGYYDIQRYNDNPYAHRWFEKRL